MRTTMKIGLNLVAPKFHAYLYSTISYLHKYKIYRHVYTFVKVVGRPRRPLASLLLKNLQSDSKVNAKDCSFFSSITSSTIDSRWSRLVFASGKNTSVPRKRKTFTLQEYGKTMFQLFEKKLLKWFGNSFLKSCLVLEKP